MFSLEFEIQGLPKMTNGLRVHWAKINRERNTWKRLVAESVLNKRGCGARQFKTLTKATVTLTRFSARQPDYDGLVSSFKGIVDGLVEAKVLIDDGPEVVEKFTYLWVYAKPKQGKIKVKVEEA